MKTSLKSLFIFLLVIVTTVEAQKSNGDVNIGKSFIIPSEILQQDREIQVYLQENWEVLFET
ncbi:MAG: hypothetical protein V3U92_04315 [Cellulophaga sp.]